MEFASGGELKDYLCSRGRLSEAEARLLFVQILKAVDHCHLLKVIHRDLKLENILFSDSEHRKIKVVDFGIAGLIQDDKAEKSRAGSCKYMAPEVLSEENTEAKPSLDVWSAGCILFALVCGELPFNGSKTSEVVCKAVKGQYQFPADSLVSYHCRKLIRSMLNVDYRKRITVKEIFSHPWITGSNHAKINFIENKECTSKIAAKLSRDQIGSTHKEKVLRLPKIKEEHKVRANPIKNEGSFMRDKSIKNAGYYRKPLFGANNREGHDKELLIALELLQTKPPVPKFSLTQTRRKRLKNHETPDKSEAKYYSVERKRTTRCRGNIIFSTARLTSNKNVDSALINK